MAATSKFAQGDVRYVPAGGRYGHEGVATHGWLAIALGMLGLALGSGYALALGELAGLYVGVSLVLAVAVLIDFRVGAVLLVLALPISASEIFPHALMGITGMNPLNLLLAATIAAFMVHGRLQRAGPVVPMPVVFLYILPMVIAGLIGVGRVHEIPSFFYEISGVGIYTERSYLMSDLLKPLVIVACGLMVGAAVARSRKPERFIVPIAVSALMVAVIQIAFAVLQGLPLAVMATPEARDFYEPLGLHANAFGRFHMLALALLFFVWAEARSPNLRLFLLITIGVLGVALLLTFSRASIMGAGLVGVIFLMWKFNARSLALALIGLILVILLAGGALYARLTHGIDQGADAVSAGRIDGIWLPLLPELATSPLFGDGLGSIRWSFPMLTGGMARVGHPHNAYLEALLDMGIIGTVLLLAFYVHVWKGFRSLSRSEWLTPELRGLFQGATAGLVAFFVTCFVGSSLRPEPEAAYLWVAIGFMYGLRHRRPVS
jgi:O-antigen ligase